MTNERLKYVEEQCDRGHAQVHYPELISAINGLKARNVINAIENICEVCGHIKAEDGCPHCIQTLLTAEKEASGKLNEILKAGEARFDNLLTANYILREALEAHHRHHQESCLVFFSQDGKPIDIETDLGEAYSESDLAEKTIEALSTPSPIIKVGVTAVIRNGAGAILLGLKGRACSKEFEGKWVTPGGRVNFGEPLEEAVKREVKEETGLEVEIRRWLPPQELIQDSIHFVFFVCEALKVGGNLSPGDDLTFAQWFDEQSIKQVDSTPITVRATESANEPAHEAVGDKERLAAVCQAMEKHEKRMAGFPQAVAIAEYTRAILNAIEAVDAKGIK